MTGEKFFFDAKKNYNSTAQIVVQTSTDGTNFDDLETISNSQLSYDEWHTFSVTIPSTDVKYVRFANCVYAAIDNVYGGKLPDGAKFAINTDGTAQDYGMVMKDASATKSFSITNKGNVDLVVTFAPVEGFTTPASLTVAAGASETFDVVMNTTTPGAKSGNVVLSFTATNATEFTIPVTGYVADPDKIYADFNDNQLPAGWSDNTGWTFSDGKAVAGYDTQMTLPALTVAEGEKLAISVMGTGSYKELYYYTSTDGGTSWSAKSTNLASSISTSAYSVVYIEGLAAGNYKLKLQGYQVKIDAINGFTLNADAPALTVDPTAAADFGKVKALPPAKTYTITNSGTGTLTGTIESSDTDKFTVSQSSFSLGAGENMTFDVALVFDTNYGAKAATITIHPTNPGLVDVVINATATTADPNIWEEDFESGVIPDSWINNGWTINRKWSEDSSVKHAYSGSSNANTLTTPRLQAAKDEVLQFEVLDAETSYPLTIKYATSRDGEFIDYATVTESGTASFVAPLEGTNYYYIQFSGRYIYLDDFSGFKLAPLAHDAAITAQSIPTTGNQYVDYTATVTVKEMAGKAEAGVVAKLYVDGVEKASDTKDLTANGTATFTMTFTPDAAIDAKKAYIKVIYEDVELTTEEIDLTIAAATVIDENATNVFTEGTKASVVLNYTKAAGKWGTITLPFQISVADLQTALGKDIKVYKYKSSTESSMTFDEATTLYAGYAHIIYSDEALDGARFFGVSFTATSANYDGSTVKFQATYEPIAAGGMEDKWGVTPNGEIMKGSAAATLKAMRGYLTASAGAHLSIFIEDATTGITTVLSSKDFETENVYNLNGQKVNKAQKGLYIVNGRKVVKK